MNIMATGMHPTFVTGRKVKTSLLNNGQSIDIRPPANGLFGIGTLQKNQDARPPGPLLDELFPLGDFCDALQEIGLCFKFF